jgi:Arc/MetJ-type ribon-helix-helix transcriptional regulator
LSETELAALDAAVASGRFANRSAALRAGLALILRESSQREIDEAYARGYGRHPQEEWVGELGLAALAALGESEGGDVEAT